MGRWQERRRSSGSYCYSVTFKWTTTACRTKQLSLRIEWRRGEGKGKGERKTEAAGEGSIRCWGRKKEQGRGAVAREDSRRGSNERRVKLKGRMCERGQKVARERRR